MRRVGRMKEQSKERTNEITTRTNERRRTRGRVNTTKRQHRLVTRRQNNQDKKGQGGPSQHKTTTVSKAHSADREGNPHTMCETGTRTDKAQKNRDTDTEGPLDTNGDRPTKQMQTNAEMPEKHQDEQHTNMKSVIAVFVSPSHLKTFKISDLSPSLLEPHAPWKRVP